MGIVERIAPGGKEWLDEIGAHAGRYRFAAQFARGARVLDAGCGVGYGSHVLAEGGAAEVVGVDIARDALEAAGREFPHARIRYVADDCESLTNVAGPFDLIVSLENIEHLQHPERFVARAAELLRETGVLVCSTPNNPTAARARPENPFHTLEFNREEFAGLLGKWFAKVKMFGQELTSAYLAAHRMSMNPAFRFGSFLQRLKGRERYRMPAPTEGDFIISDTGAKPENFIAVCTDPRRQ
ncbi:MAG: methyltransferase domain-containing protein [Acidobacteria bacterium]|nr:methyltransferase domain-containing protein [Acidobacteriota bacterium]